MYTMTAIYEQSVLMALDWSKEQEMRGELVACRWENFIQDFGRKCVGKKTAWEVYI